MTPEFKPFPKIASLNSSIIPLTNGGFAICSEEDHERLIAFSWFHVNDGNTAYAMRSEQGKLIRMHVEVFGSKSPDHINGDGLDNRRTNLRKATTTENGMNRGKFAPAYSRFKGVGWHKRDKRWVAKIKVGNKRINLGNFKEELHAALAYNVAATVHFGEFARTNKL